MEETPANQQSNSNWTGTQVYLLATVCLVLGLAIGYLVRGSASPAQPATPPTAVAVAPAPAENPHQQPPTMEQMKAMGDKAAAPIIDKIKSNPKDVEALNNAGNVYRATHQFKQAAEYYQKALAIDPKNAAIRTDLASCLYYTGDVDGALSELDRALSYDPNFFGALLNSGLIRLRAKKDTDGAIASWQQILKTKATPEQKEMIKKLIAETREKAGVSPEPKS